MEERRRREKECFGLPYGGAIAGILFGIMIIIFGVSWLLDIDIWANIGPIMAIIFGTLIVVGAIYGLTRR